MQGDHCYICRRCQTGHRFVVDQQILQIISGRAALRLVGSIHDAVRDYLPLFLYLVIVLVVELFRLLVAHLKLAVLFQLLLELFRRLQHAPLLGLVLFVNEHELLFQLLLMHFKRVNLFL